MAEETKKPEAAAATPSAAEGVVEKPVSEKEAPPAPVPEPEVPEKTAEKSDEPEKVEEVIEAEKPKAEAAAEEEKVGQSSSFKEESNVVSELPEAQKKALDEFKQLIQEALNKHEFSAPPPPPPVKEEKQAEEVKEEKPAATEETKVEETKTEEVKPEESSKAETETSEKSAPPPPAAEEKKEEQAPQPPAAEEKKEEKKEEKAPEPAAAVEKQEEKTPPPPAEAPKASTVAEVVEKTVEAIKESIVAVVTPKAQRSDSTEVAAPPTEEPKEADSLPALPSEPEEVSIWGIPLLKDERSDTILLKFLRARDFKVKDAFTMIKNTVIWRKQFGIESLLEEDLGNELEKVFFMSGFDKEGHPVCYNAFGEFQNKELYQNTFSDEEKRTKFLKRWIQFLEKNIRKLDFSPSGISTIVQVNDLTNSPGPFKRDIRMATNQALQLLQDNYPEFVAKQAFINVPWWYLAFHKMVSPFLTQRTKSKFVFSSPSKSADTLFKYITPEQVPVQYGGLSRDGEQEFSIADSATEVTIKPASKYTIESAASEVCTLVWELRVVGWEVSYAAEFVPTAESSYTVIVSKTRKVTPTDEPVISDTFKIGEPGKVLLTIDNQTSKKKKLLYRSKTKPTTD